MDTVSPGLILCVHADLQLSPVQALECQPFTDSTSVVGTALTGEGTSICTGPSSSGSVSEFRIFCTMAELYGTYALLKCSALQACTGGSVCQAQHCQGGSLDKLALPAACRPRSLPFSAAVTFPAMPAYPDVHALIYHTAAPDLPDSRDVSR